MGDETNKIPIAERYFQAKLSFAEGWEIDFGDLRDPHVPEFFAMGHVRKVRNTALKIPTACSGMAMRLTVFNFNAKFGAPD